MSHRFKHKFLTEAAAREKEFVHKIEEAILLMYLMGKSEMELEVYVEAKDGKNPGEMIADVKITLERKDE